MSSSTASANTSLTLSLLAGRYGVHRFAPDAPIDAHWLRHDGLVSLTRTDDELSLVVSETVEVSTADASETGWRALKVAGPLDFALTGILARLSGALADADISLFAISTFDTDYILVRAETVERAVAALRAAGCDVQT